MDAILEHNPNKVFSSRTFAWIYAHDRLIIILFAIMTAFIWYLMEPIIFTYDSYAYLNSAKAIAGIENSSFTYFRAPFLPLLLAVTGVATVQTFKWFILSQLMLGIGIVIIFHSTLRRISRLYGLLISLVFISAFVSFVYTKSVMTEEIYLFGWCLCINGILAYLSLPNYLRMIQIIIALLILAMTRAQGGFVAFVVLPLLTYYHPKRTLEIVIGATILFFITISYNQIFSSKVHLIEDQKVTASVSKIGITNTTGKMLFVIVYWDPFRRMNWILVHPKNGPATKKTIF